MRAYFMILTFATALLMLFPFSVKAEYPEAGMPKAERGMLELKVWDSRGRDVLPLGGEWEFYHSRLLVPADFPVTNAPEPAFINVPGVWGGQEVSGKALSNQGYGTYRLQLRIPETLRGQTLGLRIPSVATAYRLWIDGNFTASNGVVGTDRESMEPRNVPKVVYFKPESSCVELMVQVSNFVQRKGGMWQAMEFGTAEQVAHRRDIRVFYEVFITGSLIIMTIYHLALYFARQKDRASLYFACLSFLIALRTMVLGETLAVSFFPWVRWEWAVKIEYMTAGLALYFLLLFIYTHYPREVHRMAVRWTEFVTICFTLLVLAFPARVYTQIFYIYQYGFVLPLVLYIIFVYIRAARRGREGSVSNLIGLLGLGASIIHDQLFYSFLISTGDWIPFGFLFFLLTQSFHLSLRFSRAFTREEKLSSDLRLLNESLEEKIRERTYALQKTNLELEQVNRELSRKEQFRLRLLSNISHELMTPLTSLKGYIMAIVEGVIPANNTKYWDILRAKTLFLEHMIVDLFELTRLETRQIRFQMIEEPIIPLMKNLYLKYELEMRSKGLQFDLELPEDRNVDWNGLVAVVDAVRIEQVFSNLISNAQRYIPEGGRIVVKVELKYAEPANQTVVIQVTDTGPGIADMEIEHIFERYYRGSDLKKRQESGSGLGLAICKEIMAIHQGSIGVYSELGKGSTFYFSIGVYNQSESGAEKNDS